MGGLRQRGHRHCRVFGLGTSHVREQLESVYAGMVFSVLSFIVAVPSAIKVFNWTATLYRGSISFETPMIYALGFIGLFTIGGLTGLFLAALAVDVHVTDTYFQWWAILGITSWCAVMVMGFMGDSHWWSPALRIGSGVSRGTDYVH